MTVHASSLVSTIVTTNESLMDASLFNVAVIVAVAPTVEDLAVTTPSLLTVATLVLLLFQVTSKFWLALLGVYSTDNCFVVPFIISKSLPILIAVGSVGTSGISK